MYLGHFSLREAPFSITPVTDYFYPHEGPQKIELVKIGSKAH